MKVIVQNIAARKFLGRDGRWVVDQAEARDFCTLLRAYHFAEANTSVRFRVLLHSPDDGYSANIIEGVGHADGTFDIIFPTSEQAFSENNRIDSTAELLQKTLTGCRAHLN